MKSGRRENSNRKEDLQDLRTDILYLNSYQSVVPLFLMAFLGAFSFRDILIQYSLYNQVLYIWFPAALFSFTLKLILTIIYHRKKVKNKKIWRKIFYLTSTMSGLVLGSLLFFLHNIENYSYIFFIIILLGALSSGSVSTHSTSMIAFSIFNGLSLLPFSIYFIFLNNGIHTIAGLMILLFLITIFITASRVNQILSKSLCYSLENETIIEKLSQSEEKFSKSFYSGIAPMAMLSFEDAKFIDVNDAMINLIKYPKKDIIGKTPFDLELYQRPEDTIYIITEAEKSGRVANREIALTTGDGKSIHCLITIESFMLNDSAIALVMLQDFTERLEYERQLMVERDKAEKAAGAKTRFLATMSHEIRTPMNSILGMTSLALVTENREERNEYLSVVKESGDYLLVLINDILDMSKLEAGEVKIDLIDTDIRVLTANIFRTLELLALSKKLRFTKKIDNDLPEYIKTAPERLRQILINLIGNAIKFTAEGGIEMRVSRSDGSGYKHDTDIREFIEFSVIDTGIGIPQNKQGIIFDSFTQADAATFRKYGGTGLGLSICKQLSRLMKGDIRVVSEPGKGSTFSFIIPLICGEKPAVEDIESAETHEHKDAMRILIAEDNLMNQKLIHAYMKKLGREYSITENGIETIEKLRNEKFDMVLMDLEMPVLDGYEAMKKIRAGEAGAGNSDIIIYAMSAHVLKDTITKCIEDGFSGYVTKPLDLKKLKKII